MQTGGRIPQRWIFAIMGFLALFNAYAMRICLSITITEMVIPMKNAMHNDQYTCQINTTENGMDDNDVKPSNAKKYDWDEMMQVKDTGAFIYLIIYVQIYVYII